MLTLFAKRYRFLLWSSLIVTLFAVSSLAQNRTGLLSDIKGKKRVYVETVDPDAKSKIESAFAKSGLFEVVNQESLADFVFQSAVGFEIKPALGTVENRTQLPRLQESNTYPSGSRTDDLGTQRNVYEYRFAGSAGAYYTDAKGSRVTVWSKATIDTVSSSEPGSNLQTRKTLQNHLVLARQFIEQVKKL